MDFVTFGEEELCEIGPVLAGDSCDEGFLQSVGLSFVAVIGFGDSTLGCAGPGSQVDAAIIASLRGVPPGGLPLLSCLITTGCKIDPL